MNINKMSSHYREIKTIQAAPLGPDAVECRGHEVSSALTEHQSFITLV